MSFDMPFFIQPQMTLGENHLGNIRRHHQIASSQRLDLLNGYARRPLQQVELAVDDFQVSQIGDDFLDAANTGQWQRAFFQEFRVAVLISVSHRYNNILGASDQIHRTAHAFDQFARHHP